MADLEDFATAVGTLIKGATARLAALERGTWTTLPPFTGATAGTVSIKKEGSTVTCRWTGVVLAAGSGAATFVLIPAGYRSGSHSKVGECLAGTGTSEPQRVRVENNGLAWIGTATGSGARPTLALRGELSWETDDQ